MDHRNRKPDETSGRQSADAEEHRFQMILTALRDEEQVLRSDLENLAGSSGREPHLVTQLTATLQRMLFLAEKLDSGEDEARNEN